jgi:vacuolar protein sorting-associated protein VTA1
MSLTLPPCPNSIKSIQHFLKTATEHETRDPVITYWCRLAALQTGMALDKSSKEALAVLLPLMDWLESCKKDQAGNDAISNEVVASAHLENHAMKLFLYADKEDRAARFNKNVVKAFYTSGILFDVLSVFGELTPENSHYKKYAKLKAAYIHNCLKNGETPVPGPLDGGDDGPGGGEQPSDMVNPAAQPPGPGIPYGAGMPPGVGMPPGPGMQQGPGMPPGPGMQQGPGMPPLPGYPPHHYPQQPHAAAVIPQTPIQQFQNMNIQPVPQAPSGTGQVNLSVEQISKAQKYCKYAISALDYEDMGTAITNLNKALHMCQTGQNPPE